MSYWVHTCQIGKLQNEVILSIKHCQQSPSPIPSLIYSLEPSNSNIPSHNYTIHPSLPTHPTYQPPIQKYCPITQRRSRLIKLEFDLIQYLLRLPRHPPNPPLPYLARSINLDHPLALLHRPLHDRIRHPRLQGSPNHQQNISPLQKLTDRVRMVEGLLVELVEEHNMRPQRTLTCGTVQLHLILKNIDIMLIGLGIQLLPLDTAVITTYLQYIPMYLIYGIVLEILPLPLSLLSRLNMKIVDILRDYDAGFPPAHQLLHDLRQRHMPLVGFCLYFYLVEVTQPFPCDCWMPIEEFRRENDLRLEDSVWIVWVDDCRLFLPEAVVASESRDTAGRRYPRPSKYQHLLTVLQQRSHFHRIGDIRLKSRLCNRQKRILLDRFDGRIDRLRKHFRQPIIQFINSAYSFLRFLQSILGAIDGLQSLLHGLILHHLLLQKLLVPLVQFPRLPQGFVHRIHTNYYTARPCMTPTYNQSSSHYRAIWIGRRDRIRVRSNSRSRGGQWSNFARWGWRDAGGG